MNDSPADPPDAAGSTSWYARCLAHLRNHGRVDPAKVELPHCDFFIVGQRRTLRILKPPLTGRWFYEPANDRPESVNDNFFSRWSKRPHPSGNCRCSFRRSARLGDAEERVVSREMDRIRSSLREAERNGRDVGEIERKVRLDDPIPVSVEPKKNAAPRNEEKTVKSKIIKDLERYINDLLQEILTDSVKFVADAEKLGCRNAGGIPSPKDEDEDEEEEEEEEKKGRERNAPRIVDGFVNINFDFRGDGEESTTRAKVAPGNVEGSSGPATGYENPAFVGSSNDPDNLEFHLDRRTVKSGNLEQLDCVDSGINSVETVEFQPDQEPSLEESLMEIIDAKLGRTRLRKSWEDFKSPEVNEGRARAGTRAKEEEEEEEEAAAETDSLAETGGSGVAENLETLDEVVGGSNFDELRLEFGNERSGEEVRFGRGADSLGSRGPTRAEDEDETESSSSFAGCGGRDPNVGGSRSSTRADSRRDLVALRKNRKPTIVFLHGFGSSADVFERQLEYFSSLGYPCIAPDMLGHGLSSAPDRASDYRFEKLFNDLEVLLHHYAFKPSRKCVIVAHNYGCSFAAALACKYEENVHQLVLVSGGGPTPLARPSAEGAAHCCFRALMAPLLVCGLRREVMYSPRGRQHPYCGSEPAEQRPSHMRHVADGMVWPEGECTLYRRIRAPTLLVHGLKDNEVSLVQECQMERTMVKAFLEALPSAGHNPMADCPEQLNHMIHCFIDLWKNKKW